MNFAVCEASSQMLHGDDDWLRLVEINKKHRPDVLLLNEMPFGRWISAEPEPDREQLLASHNAHDHGLDHLGELSAGAVLSTRPTFEDDRSVNQAFVWTDAAGLVAVHTKQFFPNESGYYEARWFERGNTRFGVAGANGINVGFLICTDVMFPEWARFYGRNSVHVIAVPRATPVMSLERWKTMMRAAAIMSGCYVASSNRIGIDKRGQEFGGRGWIVAPSGQVVAETSTEHPIATALIDLSLVAEAKAGYPAYVDELPIGIVAEVLGKR